jgi:CheY-like chemotaxis protein
MTQNKPKILLIEDDMFMRRLYSDVFTLEGFDFATAENGEEGLLQIYKEAPALILLDIMMPNMNGLEVLEKLKIDPRTKNIPVVMLTNLSGKTEENNAIQKGATKYLVKSEYEPKQIVGIVKEILVKLTH